MLGNTVLATPDDAGVVRLEGAGSRGIALALDGPARFCQLDPYAGAQLALAEAYRNVAATGAVPYAVTDCLNFGSPEEPEVMWAFAETCRGLADGCRELELPVTGGNVSFYNATGGTAILPTPVIGVMGVFDDVERRTSSGFCRRGRRGLPARRHRRRIRRIGLVVDRPPPPRRHASGGRPEARVRSRGGPRRRVARRAADGRA